MRRNPAGDAAATRNAGPDFTLTPAPPASAVTASPAGSLPMAHPSEIHHVREIASARRQHRLADPRRLSRRNLAGEFEFPAHPDMLANQSPANCRHPAFRRGPTSS